MCSRKFETCFPLDFVFTYIKYIGSLWNSNEDDDDNDEYDGNYNNVTHIWGVST